MLNYNNILGERYQSKGIVFSVKKIQKKRFVSIEFDTDIHNNSIGCVQGEIIGAAFKYAYRKRLPVVAYVSSTGMKITEGTIALMQMAKIVEVVKKHSNKGLLYICVIDNLTLGGISASLVALADIIIGKDDVTFGFSGRRIIEKTISEILPDDFQTVGYAYNHGMIDIIVNGEKVENIIEKLLQIHER